MEDDLGIRDLTVNALTYCVNREILSFRNGRAAWDYLMQGGQADIIISDVDMPQMDGFELMERVKAKGSATIFIIMSGVDDYEEKAELLGADAFLAKPFAINDLFNIVQAYVVD